MMIKNIYNNLINANLNLPPDSLEFKKVRIINFILYISVIVNLLVIGENFKAGQIVYGYASISDVIIGSIGILLLRGRVYNIRLVSHLAIVIILLVLYPALFEGGIANSGFVWFALLPLFSIFLLGVKIGLRWIGLFIVSNILVFIFYDFMTLPYEKEYLIYLTISLILETMFVYLLQNIQDLFEYELNEKNAKLEDLTLNLKEEVRKQVADNREKDQMIAQQSKMASLGEMISNISHQWKQPLQSINVVVADAQICTALEEEDFEVEKSFQDILKQTALMQKTMDDFLHFSSPHAIDVKFSVNNAIRMMISLVKPSFVNKHIAFEFEEKSTEAYLVGKESEFIHAIMNIANNAKDVIASKNLKNAQFKISLEKRNGYIIILMSDNAGGIADNVITHIFEPYFTTKVEDGGTGLGLELTHKVIVDHLFGTIDVENINEGVQFRMTLHDSFLKEDAPLCDIITHH